MAPRIGIGKSVEAINRTYRWVRAPQLGLIRATAL